MNFDSQTLAFVLAVVSSLQAIILWIQSRFVRFYWCWWCWGSLCFAAGLAGSLLTSELPSQQLAVASSGLVLGSALIYLGSRDLTGLQTPLRRKWLGLILFSLVLILGFVNTDSADPRMIQMIVAGSIATLSGLTTWTFHRYRVRPQLLAIKLLKIIFAATTSVLILLAIWPLVGLTSDRQISTDLAQLAIYCSLLIASTFWTFGVILLVNQEAIATSKEAQLTTEQIFNASPDAILMTRLSDGKIIKFNDSFLALTGLIRAELFNASILDLDFWKQQSDRQAMINCLLNQGSCEDLEVTLQRPDQTTFIGLVTAKLIQVSGVLYIISITQDITKRRQVEESLRQSEERFDLAVRGSLSAIWDWNILTGELYHSPRYLEMLGYSPEDLPPRSDSGFFNLVHPADRIAVQVALESHFSPAQYPYEVEFRLRTNTGEYRWFQSTGIAVRNSDGEPYRMVGATLDITQRKQAEAALRESEQNYRTLVNSGQALIWLSDSNGFCYYFNSVWLDFTGRSLEQESGEGWVENIHIDDRQNCLDTYRLALKEQQYFRIEYRLCRHDGEYRWILDEGSPRYDSGGQFIGYISHCLDIHDRKQTEAALQREQEFTRTLLESIADGVAACDAQGNLVLFNRTAREWHGLNALTISPENWSYYYSLYQADGVTPLAVDEIPLVRAFNQEQVSDVEMVIRAKNAETRQLLASGGPFFDSNKQLLGAVIAMRDVTAQRKVENQLRLSLTEAERFRTALDQVSSYVYMKDLQSSYIYANRATLDLFGCSEQALLGCNDTHFFPREVAQQLQAIDARVFQGEKTAEEVQIIDPSSGQVRIYWEVQTPIYETSDSKKIVGLLGIATDITERKNLEERLQQQATTDGLTGIHNRRHFVSLAQVEIKRAHRLHHPFAIALIDIDHFKTINDTHGHIVGDQTLLIWTQVCLSNIREVDIFARLGGDEFVVFFPETTGEKASQIMERIRQSIVNHPIHLDDRTVTVTISVGIVTSAVDVFSLEQLLERADDALYQAKKLGRNRVVLAE